MLRPSGLDNFARDEHECPGTVASDTQLLTFFTSWLCLVLRRYVSLALRGRAQGHCLPHLMRRFRQFEHPLERPATLTIGSHGLDTTQTDMVIRTR